jgi:hypothetical protein
MNHRQRVVVVVGLGFALYVFGQWATTRGGAFGWVAYAPLSRATFSPPGYLHPWVQLLIWLGLTVVWVATSVVLLRRPKD